MTKQKTQPEMTFGMQLEDQTIQREFMGLHPVLRMWINEETMWRMINLTRAENEHFNATKHWWQKRKPTHFMIDHTPRMFTLPPFFIEGYDEAKMLVERRLKMHLQYEKLIKETKHGKSRRPTKPAQ